MSTPATVTAGSKAANAKAALYSALAGADDEPKAPPVVAAIEVLASLPPCEDILAAGDGMWEVISKPDFPDSLGLDATGRHCFTLGRASFNMYQPLGMPIAIESIKNEVVPLGDGDERSYRVIVQFETAGDTGTPLRGVMDNAGLCVGDAEKSDRLGVQFTGGAMRPAEGTSLRDWSQVFAQQDQRGMGVGARFAGWMAKRLFALQRPTGIDADGAVSYAMKKAPQGYLDVLYLDEELRITRGNRGSIVIAKRAAPP